MLDIRRVACRHRCLGNLHPHGLTNACAISLADAHRDSSVSWVLARALGRRSGVFRARLGRCSIAAQAPLELTKPRSFVCSRSLSAFRACSDPVPRGCASGARAAPERRGVAGRAPRGRRSSAALPRGRRWGVAWAPHCGPGFAEAVPIGCLVGARGGGVQEAAPEMGTGRVAI